jgi:hypothetical protein
MSLNKHDKEMLSNLAQYFGKAEAEIEPVFEEKKKEAKARHKDSSPEILSRRAAQLVMAVLRKESPGTGGGREVENVKFIHVAAFAPKDNWDKKEIEALERYRKAIDSGEEDAAVIRCKDFSEVEELYKGIEDAVERSKKVVAINEEGKVRALYPALTNSGSASKFAGQVLPTSADRTYRTMLGVTVVEIDGKLKPKAFVAQNTGPSCKQALVPGRIYEFAKVQDYSRKDRNELSYNFVDSEEEKHKFKDAEDKNLKTALNKIGAQQMIEKLFADHIVSFDDVQSWISVMSVPPHLSGFDKFCILKSANLTFQNLRPNDNNNCRLIFERDIVNEGMKLEDNPLTCLVKKATFKPVCAAPSVCMAVIAPFTMGEGDEKGFLANLGGLLPFPGFKELAENSEDATEESTGVDTVVDEPEEAVQAEDSTTAAIATKAKDDAEKEEDEEEWFSEE